MDIRRKTLDLAEFKMLKESPNGSCQGYMCRTDNVDRVAEKIAQDAIKNVDAFLRDGFGAVGHDWDSLPVGTIKSIAQDERGYRVEIEFHSTQAAQDCRMVIQERLERGKSVGMSIGYRVLDSEVLVDEDGTEYVLLKAIELYEASIVTVPCNPRAGVTDVKASAPTLTLEDHHQTALAAVGGYAKRIRDLKDLRETQGRELNEVNRDRLQQLHDAVKGLQAEIQALLKAIHPRVSEEQMDEVRAILASLTLDATPR